MVTTLDLQLSALGEKNSRMEDIFTYLLTHGTFCLCSEHDWFKIDLPEYLFPSASDVDASVVDTDAIREVCEV